MDKQKEKTKIFKHNLGITLIALVITIIVLLILAGVALATLTGNTSIIDNANNAVERYNKSADEDQKVLNQVKDLFAKYMGGEQAGGTENDDDDDTPPAQTYTITYNANGGTGIMNSETASATGTNGFTAPSGKVFRGWNTLADGSGTSYAEGAEVTSDLTLYAIWGVPVTTLSTGQNASVDENGYATVNTRIVADATNNIQIVIPIGFAPAILNGSNSTTSAPGEDGSVKSVMPAAQWSSITAAQINAGVVVKNAAGEEFVWVPIPSSSNFARTAWTWTDKNSTKTQTLADTSTENAYWEETGTTEYANMVSSVNTNKGFYISRYEASQGTGNVAQSKRGETQWVSIAQNNSSKDTDAIRASSANSIANTHLMYGIEWDSVLSWIEDTTELSATDSRNWGNHSDSISPANNSPWAYRENQNVAASEYWKANNIYDLAGNVSEWTQEKYSTGIYRVERGESYGNSGGYYPVATRGYNDESRTNIASTRFSFQFLLVAMTSGSDTV